MMRNIFRHLNPTRLFVLGAVVMLTAGLAQAQKGQKSPGAVPSRPDTRTIAHVLDRIGFGARPGDIERVEKMGLAKYIDQQLYPEKIPDKALEERLNDFPTLKMSTTELAQNYFNPADEARRLQQQAQARAAAANDMNMTTATPPPQGAGRRGQPPPANQSGQPPAPPPPPTPEQRALQQRAQSVTQELMQGKMLRAALSERQLQEVLTDFWFNHFNVFIGKGQVRQYLTEYERDAIRPYVLGNFRDMLGATAHSPAMLFYLDNFQSRTPNPAPFVGRGRGQFPNLQQRLADPRLTPEQRQQILARLNVIDPQQQRRQGGLNENYARELMELHTLGVDGGYTQQDVIEVAKILTGWTIDRPQQGGSFTFNAQFHDTGTKTVLGKTFKNDGQQEGERLLDMLAMHPQTAHHIAFKLAQRFVADEPPAALVDRAARRFLETKGDLREVTRTIITSPEFFDQKYYAAKVKTPLEFVISAVRATNAEIVNPQPMVQALNQLGMPLYGAQPPTGYSMTADAWVNTGALLARMNFAQQLVNQGIPQGAAPAGRGGRGAPPPDVRPGQPPARGAQPPVRPAQQQGAGRAGQAANQMQRQLLLTGRGPLQVDIPALAPDTSSESIDRAIDTLLASGASDATRQVIAKATTPQQIVALTLGSPEFQKR
ncbi:MAG TPA: DUF1800 domain-containing protein [Vicinamibacterales bacterium]|nr:DUF1800 domain-containing protein [Vicinamibacterales bacterium]